MRRFPLLVCLPEGTCKLVPYGRKPWVERGIRKERMAEPKLCFLLFENFIWFKLNSSVCPVPDADGEKTVLSEGAGSVLREPASASLIPRH